jgi:hypothetical protein
MGKTQPNAQLGGKKIEARWKKGRLGGLMTKCAHLALHTTSSMIDENQKVNKK